MITAENVVKLFRKYGYSIVKSNNQYIVIDNRTATEIFSTDTLEKLAVFASERTFLEVSEYRLTDYINHIKRKYTSGLGKRYETQGSEPEPKHEPSKKTNRIIETTII